MGVNEKLMEIQKELKAPKNQYNSFGKYSYRSCEDILEGVKPLLKKYKATIIISDDIELIGDRFYVKATAKFVDVETGEFVENAAYARESDVKKGMDDSQITGATSSYARKYALNGLFLIDDTKDSDTDEYQEQQKATEEKAPTPSKTTKKAVSPKAEPTAEELAATPPEQVDKRLTKTKDGKMSEEQYKFLLEEIERTGAMKDVVAYTKTSDLTTISSAKCVALLTGLIKRPTKTKEN